MDTITGVELIPEILPGTRMHKGGHINHPVLKTLASDADAECAEDVAAVAEELLENEGPAVSDGILLTLRLHEDWRVSYCQPQPSCRQYLDKVAKVRNNLRAVEAGMVPGISHESKATLLKRDGLRRQQRQAAYKRTKLS